MTCKRKCKNCTCQTRQAEKVASESERTGGRPMSLDRPKLDPDSDLPDADGSALGILAVSEEARRRWPEFVEAFREGQPRSQQSFAVQALCRAGRCSAVRLLWFTVTAIESHVVRGLAVGDGKPIEAQVSDVIDWMHLDSRIQKMEGLFTEDAVERQANNNWLRSEAG